MHDFKGKYISKEEIIPVAEKMLKEKRRLLIMNGYIDKEEKKVIAYNYCIDGDVETYLCSGYDSIPSITGIYGGSAQWCEEEISELMSIEFEGLKKSGRLFLPDDFDGSGQILVLPIDDLKKCTACKEAK